MKAVVWLLEESGSTIEPERTVRPKWSTSRCDGKNRRKSKSNFVRKTSCRFVSVEYRFSKKIKFVSFKIQRNWLRKRKSIGRWSEIEVNSCFSKSIRSRKFCLSFETKTKFDESSAMKQNRQEPSIFNLVWSFFFFIVPSSNRKRIIWWSIDVRRRIVARPNSAFSSISSRTISSSLCSPRSKEIISSSIFRSNEIRFIECFVSVDDEK